MRFRWAPCRSTPAEEAHAPFPFASDLRPLPRRASELRRSPGAQEAKVDRGLEIIRASLDGALQAANMASAVPTPVATPERVIGGAFLGGVAGYIVTRAILGESGERTEDLLALIPGAVLGAWFGVLIFAGS